MKKIKGFLRRNYGVLLILMTVLLLTIVIFLREDNWLDKVVDPLYIALIGSLTIILLQRFYFLKKKEQETLDALEREYAIAFNNLNCAQMILGALRKPEDIKTRAWLDSIQPHDFASLLKANEFIFNRAENENAMREGVFSGVSTIAWRKNQLKDGVPSKEQEIVIARDLYVFCTRVITWIALTIKNRSSNKIDYLISLEKLNIYKWGCEEFTEEQKNMAAQLQALKSSK